MNLAPYLFSIANGWRLSSDSVPENLQKILDENQDFIKKIIEDHSYLFKAINFSEIKIENPVQAGLYLVSQIEWLSLFGNFIPEDNNYVSYSGEFVSGIDFHERAGVLMFPDDSSSEFNISFFSPTVNSQRELILNSIKLWLDFDIKKIRNIFSGKSNECVLSIKGEYPKRKFKCSSTGCIHECTAARFFKGNIPIIECECCKS